MGATVPRALSPRARRRRPQGACGRPLRGRCVPAPTAGRARGAGRERSAPHQAHSRGGLRASRLRTAVSDSPQEGGGEVINKKVFMRTDIVQASQTWWKTINLAPGVATHRVTRSEFERARRLGGSRASVARDRATGRHRGRTPCRPWCADSTRTILGDTASSHTAADRGRAHELRRGGAR